MTYVEAVESQCKEDFISACENAFYYYGGPKAIVPDNVKSAVTRADRLAAACRRAEGYGKYSFREIQDILQNKSEALDLPEEPADMPEHGNIRGKEYYK